MKKAPSVQFGDVKIDLIEYASRANGILGIRDSGKTITAKFFAEALHTAGIPFVSFDPSGAWKSLRLPGKGKGIPVVVAGSGGDLPLTPNTAATIVEAAMKSGVSLVIDLSGHEYSKTDWRRIVMSAVNTLLRKNAEYGLRHVFLEEAAEFVPQKPYDNETFAAVEKLARIGGNSRVGLTLINQRAAEVAKSVLELCDNLFLHRQRGFRSIENLQKWMDIAEVDESSEIVKSLSTLPTGVCWAWLAEQGVTAHRVKVPMIQSGHPDRRSLHGAVLKAKKAVDVGSFVEAMRSDLGKVEEEAKANDPKHLKAEVVRLTQALAKKTSPAGATKAELKAEYDRGFGDGQDGAYRDGMGIMHRAFEAAVKQAAGALRASIEKALGGLEAEVAGAALMTPPSGRKAPPAAKGFKTAIVAMRPANPATAALVASVDGYTVLSAPEGKVMAALAFWRGLGFDAPSRAQVAAVAGYSLTSGGFANLLGKLKTAGLIDYPTSGVVTATPAGLAVPVDTPTGTVRERLGGVLSAPQQKIVDTLLGPDYGGGGSRAQLASDTGYSPTSGGYANLLGSLRTLSIIDYPMKGEVKIADWVAL